MAKARFREPYKLHDLLPAMRLFRQAALLTYNIDPRPEAHTESLALLESTHDKVTKHFRRSYLDAQRELQLKGRAAACRAR